MNEIVEKAKELGELLKQSDEFKNYNEVKAKYEADTELEKFIFTYVNVKNRTSLDNSTVYRALQERRQQS